MKIASAEALARLLAERLAASGEPGRAVTVAQLVERILPYPLVRERLGLAGKAEYDLAVLRLLADRVLLQLDPALHEAATKELEQPEPDLRPLEKLSESLLRVRDPARATRSREAGADRDETADDSESGSERHTSAPGTGLASSTAESPSGMVPEPAAEPESDAGVEPESDAGAAPESEHGAEPPSGPAAESAPDAAGGTGPAPPAGTDTQTERESVAEPPPEPGRLQEERRGVEPATPHPTASLPEPSLVGPTHPDPSARTTDRPPAEPRRTGAPGTVACRSCVAPLPNREGVRFCPHCGVDQQAARCTSCGDRLEPGWFFCPRCGRALDRP